jgi:N-acyl homoserine lactone hydrolase
VRAPSVHRLRLTDVTPAEHLPWARGPMVVNAYLVDHPDGPILYDTGVGHGSRLIDDWYSPVHQDLDEALRRFGCSPAEVVAVVNSHLHFDHCGQNPRFPGVPIVVQRAELDVARGPRYTVAEWVDFPGVAFRVLDGAAAVAPGVRVVPTPGHTVGHQSVVVDTDDGPVVLYGQASEGLDDFVPPPWLVDLGPAARVVFAHDDREWSSTA